MPATPSPASSAPPAHDDGDLPTLERLTRLVARLLGAPIAFVTLLEGSKLHVETSPGARCDIPRVIPLSRTAEQALLEMRAPLRLADARTHPLLGPHADAFGIVAYLGVPLVSHEGEMIGTVCACDVRAREWTDEEERLLVDLASAVTAELSLRRELARRDAGAAEQRELEERLRQAERLESLGRLAAGVAHDFNNLLMVVGGNLEFVRQRLLAAGFPTEEVDEIEIALQRGGELTRQLMVFGRRPRRVTRTVDLVAQLRELSLVLGRLLGEHVQLELQLPDAPVLALVEPGQLEQVALNLVLNARDAMPGGGTVRVHVDVVHVGPRSARARAGMAVGDYAALVVHDEGVGMDATTRARIFEPFFTTKPSGEGTGLGLPTVYGIARQSGGAVEVDTAPGRGTTFTVLLPLGPRPAAGEGTPSDESGAEHPSNGAAHDARDAPDGRTDDGRPPTPRPALAAPWRATVLLVEDEARVRATVRRMLERLGYAVVEAGHGREALDVCARGTHIDLVLTDVVMPEMGAVALVERLRAEHPGLPVVLMSGYSEQAVRSQDFAGLGLEVLEKPFEPAMLGARLRAALGAGGEAGRAGEASRTDR